MSFPIQNASCWIDVTELKLILVTSEWTVEEKRKLLLALQQCGTNIAQVQNLLPHKTITDIRFVFEKYTKLASESKNENEKLREEDSAINQWIKILKTTQEHGNGVNDIVSRVIKYIALFEKRPNDKNVNLKDCYLALSGMTDGRVSTCLNSSTSDFFYENLSRLAMKLKKSNDHSKKIYIRSMKNLDHINKSQGLKTYNRKKKKVNAILNPLNVPDSLLKISEESGEKV